MGPPMWTLPFAIPLHRHFSAWTFPVALRGCVLYVGSYVEPPMWTRLHDPPPTLHALLPGPCYVDSSLCLGPPPCVSFTYALLGGPSCGPILHLPMWTTRNPASGPTPTWTLLCAGPLSFFSARPNPALFPLNSSVCRLPT